MPMHSGIWGVAITMETELLKIMKRRSNGIASRQNREMLTHSGYWDITILGVAHDEEIFKCYRKSAEEGNAEGQCRLGECFYYGRGVAENHKEAVKWYRRSGEAGDARGQYKLGNCYYDGRGVAKDYEKAVKWYRKSAEEGNAVGQYKLGDCYYDGRGVTKDYEEAVKWYRKSAEEGNAYGRWRLQRLRNKNEIK